MCFTFDKIDDSSTLSYFIMVKTNKMCYWIGLYQQLQVYFQGLKQYSNLLVYSCKFIYNSGFPVTILQQLKDTRRCTLQLFSSLKATLSKLVTVITVAVINTVIYFQITHITRTDRTKISCSCMHQRRQNNP